MDDKVLTYSQLTAEDRAIYMGLVNAPRCREQAEEYKEQAENRWGGRGSLLAYELLRLYTIIRGRYFHYDEKRAERIQIFLKDMQVKYDCDSIDRRVFPGSDERWQ
jgi:hypothetical protein